MKEMAVDHAKFLPLAAAATAALQLLRPLLVCSQ